MEEELSDGDIVWVRVSNSWWPGEVMGDSRLSEEFLSSLRKKPLAVVKFFQEDSYEFVKNPSYIFKYNCPRKMEFLRKGLEQYRAKMKHMEKFPADVMHAERATGGDPDIVNSTDFSPQKKERHSGSFVDGRTPGVKGKGQNEKVNTPSKLNTSPFSFGSGRKTVHEVRILAQSSITPSKSELHDLSLSAETVSPAGGSLSSPSQVYHCYKCNNFSASRQNMLMVHLKYCKAIFSPGSGISSGTTITPHIAPARKASLEKMNDTDEVDDPDPYIKNDQSQRSLLGSGKIDELLPAKSEPSNEKRTRGGRKSTPMSEAPKQKKAATARRRTKRDHSPLEQEEDKLDSTNVSGLAGNQSSVNIHVKEEEEAEEHQRLKAERGSEAANREESTASNAVKNKTDVKLKNELLADWSEDEQEDDEGEKKEDIVEKVEEKTVPEANQSSTPAKDVSPVRTTKASTKKNQHKDSKQEAMKQQTASKKATKLETKNETSAIVSKDEERVGEDAKSMKVTAKMKVTEKDAKCPPESSAAVVATTALIATTDSNASAAAGVSVVSTSTSSSTPTASPYATIKYRNIPKKQKREFIEVTNDDVSIVQEKYAVPSREGSTASSSSTAGSSEACTGTAQSTTAPPAVPAAERPISAKQLILNRATRGSSKSLSGDEIATGTTPAVTAEQASPSASKDITKVAAQQEERKSQTEDTMKKTDVRQQESSCFDFNDDEDDHQSGENEVTQKTTVVSTRFDRKRDQAAATRQKSAMVAPEAPEVDRDAQLSQEIDSLLSETDVPKLPEDLSDVITAVADKIDCNRTLPPKERGKRIFKTRNKTVTASSSSSPKQLEEQAPSEEAAVEAETMKNNGDSNTAVNKATVEQTLEKQQQLHEEKEQTVKEKDESTKQEDHQNPSVTSSAMAEDGTTEAEERQQQPEQSESSKKKRKSEEALLPDSSGNGDQQPVSATRRRGKYSRVAAEVVKEKSGGEKSLTTQQLSEAREISSRKGKRLRRDGSAALEIVPATDSGHKSSADGVNTTDRVVSSEIQTITAVVDTEDVTDSSNVKETPKQPTSETAEKHGKTKREDGVADATPAPPSTSLALKATPTDLQVAEALINLPTVVAAPLPVSSSSSSAVVEEDKVPSIALTTAVEPLKKADTFARSSSPVVPILTETVVQSASTSSANSSSNSSSATKSINPRKRHLQTMMLGTTEATNLPQSKKVAAEESPSSASEIEKEITTVKVVLPPEQDAPSIPEKKKRNELVVPVGEMASKESSPLLTEVDKFDINSMPIVMDDSELLVDGNSSVTKSLNGAVSAVMEVSESATVTSKDKRPTTVAMVKGGKSSSEQIVITSKGTVLTTSTASISVASKLPTSSSSSSKSSVTVTSAITLSSSCRVASSTPVSSVVSSPLSFASSATATGTQLVPPKIIITKKPLPQVASTSTASSKVGGSVDGAKAQPERRLSGDGASSSVSSSSGSETATGKKSHRVLRLTPQKLKEFSRLGYIEDRQGKGKMLTKSGMRQLYGKQPQLQQQQQQHLSKKKPVPISAKIITTTDGADGADVIMAPDSNSGPRATSSLSEVASSGSNVVIAAAADSSVQESSATVGRTTSSDTSAVEMEEDEELLEQQKISSEMGELPASTHVTPVGATIVLEGSPSSSGTGGGAAAEVLLGSTELAIVGGGSATEASSSSTSSGGGGSGTAATTAGSGEQESSQLMAVPAENFGGPPNLFYLCSVRDESLVPVNNELLYLDASNQLVALEDQSQQQHPAQQQGSAQQSAGGGTLTEEIINQAEVIIPTVGSNGAEMAGDGTGEGGAVTATGAVGTDGAQEGFVFNTQDGQHIILDPQSLMALAAGGETPHLITADGQEIILQESAQEWLAALQQQQQQAGAVSTLVTPEGTQIIVAHENAGLIELQEHPVLLPPDIIQVNPNTTIETNAVLTKPPIMSTVEVPSKNGIESAGRTGDRKSAAAVVSPRIAAGSTAPVSGSTGGATASHSKVSTGSNLDETLAAVIGHVPSNPHVPTSLELPITVTNPVIAKTSTASSRLNAVAAAAAQLFPLTTTTTTAVSSFADATTATVVLVSGAEVPGTIDPHPRSPSPLAAASSCSSPSEDLTEEEQEGVKKQLREEVSEKESMMTVQKEEGNGDCADDHCGEDVSEKEKSACLDEDDIQIPNTPESVPTNDERQQRYDDEMLELDGEQRESNENHLLLVNEDSNCSEIIAIQPNVVVLDGDMLLNSPPDEADDDEEDDGIDDDLMEHDSEEDDMMVIDDDLQQQQQQQQQQRHQAGHNTVQARSFDQRSLPQHPRARNNGPPSAANGTDGRRDTMNLAEHHNSSSNNDSGIDTSMAVTVGSAACEATITAASALPSSEGATVRHTIPER